MDFLNELFVNYELLVTKMTFLRTSLKSKSALVLAYELHIFYEPLKCSIRPSELGGKKQNLPYYLFFIQ